jgi:hypothetical protein
MPPLTHPREGRLREALAQVLVLGCSYEKIADAACSPSRMRCRRDEWIEFGAMERLREICLDA